MRSQNSQSVPAGRCALRRTHAIRQTSDQWNRVGEQAGVGVVEREVERGLRIVAGEFKEAGEVARQQSLLVPRPMVERIGGEQRDEHFARVRGASEPAQHRRLQHVRLVVLPIRVERGFEMRERCREVSPTAIQRREFVISGGPPFVVPSRPVEQRIRTSRPVLPAANEAEVIMRLPRHGIRVAFGQPRDRFFEVAGGIVKLPAAQSSLAQGEVATRIARIPAQRLAPITLGVARGMAVLFEVFADEKELVGGLRVRRCRRLGRDRPPAMSRIDFHGPVADDFGSGGIEQAKRDAVGAVAGEAQIVVTIRRAGMEIDECVEEDTSVLRQHDSRPVERRRNEHAEIDAPVIRDDEPQRRPLVGRLHRARLLDRPPELGKRPRFVGREVGEVGLVVGVDAGHQLDVRAAGVGQLAIPSVTEGVIAPGPLLLAGRDMAVGDMHKAALGLVIVAAEEIERRLADHVAGRDGDVAIPSEVVGAGPVLIAHAVVRVVCEGEGRLRADGMIGHVVHVGREERLIAIVHAGGDVGPPEKGLRERCAVEQPRPQLDQRAARPKPETVHPLEAVERIVLAHPHRARPVGFFLDEHIGGQERSRPVMLRPVELDATRDPRAGEADERRFDHVLPVEEIVVFVRLVLAEKDASANFRQHHETHEFVFQPRRAISDGARLIADLVDERHWIDLAARTLVDAFFEEDGIFLRCTDGIGRHGEGFEAGGDGLRHVESTEDYCTDPGVKFPWLRCAPVTVGQIDGAAAGGMISNGIAGKVPRGARWLPDLFFGSTAARSPNALSSRLPCRGNLFAPAVYATTTSTKSPAAAGAVRTESPSPGSLNSK